MTEEQEKTVVVEPEPVAPAVTVSPYHTTGISDSESFNYILKIVV